jgi:HPr kinase/phosphorylase
MSDEAARVTVDAVVRASAAAGVELEVLGGQAGLDRTVDNLYPQKAGLALAGFDAALQAGRVLVFGQSEVRYLSTRLEPEARVATLVTVFEHGNACVVLTKSLEPPPGLIATATIMKVPVLRTALSTPVAFAKLGALLDDMLAPRDSRHGVLVDVLGLGVLMIGESGIGKSECALELIRLGHRLVSDDVVDVRRRGGAIVIGTCPPLTRHHMELRGIGLINVRDLFGVTATRTSKRVELVVKLERWDPSREYERLGLDETFEDILGVPIASVCMPVAPGRNLAILVEVAVRNHLLRTRGEHAAGRLAARLDSELGEHALDPAAGEDPEEAA